MSLRRAQFAFAGLFVAALALAGCTIRPVYSEPGGETTAAAFRYDTPSDRLAMVARDTLTVHFPPTSDPSAPRVRITASARGGDLTLSRNAGRPTDNSQTRATVTVRVYNDSGTIFSASRFAVAYYQVNGQVFADKEARTEADERAVASAAESLRLAFLANLAKLQSQPVVLGR